MDDLRLGGVVLDRRAAMEHATSYLTRGHGWAYPSYDGFDAEHATGPLVDADLLAPLLLNVNRISISTYQALQRVRPRLQEVLTRIEVDLSLVDADEKQVTDLGNLFVVLDGASIKGARGAVLSKLLHRKRPALIPLYDKQVRGVYQDGSSAPVPVEPGRSWGEFWPLFARAVQGDLRRELPFWQEIVSLAPGPPITPLRALDIVAWWAGRADATRGTRNSVRANA